MTGLTIALAIYFSLNFACALALHIHAEHQAHLRIRFMDVLVHFVLLTAFGLPVLLAITIGALFGRAPKLPKTPVTRPRAA